ncbi:hypothetical protein EDC96DRAFT_140200 [Choanephora cucurbitarum]|nr:hypothetical protein EDC96DRAFT_140200 [Choanephora cucurbitarum]
MLRVSSILYLEKVWSSPTVALLRETRSIYTPSITVDEAPSLEVTKYTSEDEAIVVKEDGLPNDAVISSSNSVSTLESGDDSPGMTNSLFSASSSLSPETPQTQSPEEIKVISPPNVTSDMIHSACQYYDDVSDEDLQKPVQSNISFSSKLSPKRILRGSRSNLSRRRSLFLEKFSHHPLNQEIPPITDPILANDTNTSSLDVFRRKSAKLSTKGKSLSKRIRRVISFHH